MQAVNLNFKFFLFFLLFITISYFSHSSRVYLNNKYESIKVEEIPYYLPKKSGLKYLSLGFNTLTSKIIWFDTLNYFGRRFQEKRDFPWLATMCELVTSMDSKGRHYVEFCATALSWMAKEPNESLKILNSAIEADNSYWKYYYLRAFNYWYFLKDYVQAKEDLVHASQLESAPSFIASLASRLLNQEEGPSVAREFIEQLMKNTSDPKILLELGKRLKESIFSEGMQKIKIAVEDFYKKYQRLPTDINELLTSNFLKSIPVEPFGGQYQINQNSGEIYSTSGKIGLKFNAKTFDTGILKNEFIQR